jgi:hypothetical protein
LFLISSRRGKLARAAWQASHSALIQAAIASRRE